MLPGPARTLRAVCTRVAGVLLAAGEGSRFGRPKALVELDGLTLAERGVNLLRAGGANPILVVTGAAQVELSGTETVFNDEWRTGMGSSLRAALNALNDPAEARDHDPALPSDVGAAVVALADQPLVGPEAVARLIAAYRAGAGVAVACYEGNPRCWPASTGLRLSRPPSVTRGPGRSCAPARTSSRSSNAATPVARTTSTRPRTLKRSPVVIVDQNPCHKGSNDPRYRHPRPTT